jgi:sigma-E factor negative regulatory protein RseC
VDGNFARVEIQRSGGCGSCAMRGFCFKKGEPAVFDVRPDIPLQEGDLVNLEIAPSTRVGSALVIFGLPLVMMFVGFLIARNYFGELLSIGIAFTALALSFAIVGRIDRKYGKGMIAHVGGIYDHKTQ